MLLTCRQLQPQWRGRALCPAWLTAAHCWHKGSWRSKHNGPSLPSVPHTALKRPPIREETGFADREGAAGGRWLKICSRFDLCHNAAVKWVKEEHQRGWAGARSCVLVSVLQLPYISYEVRLHRDSVSEITHSRSVSCISDSKLSQPDVAIHHSIVSVWLSWPCGLWYILTSQGQIHRCAPACRS